MSPVRGEGLKNTTVVVAVPVVVHGRIIFGVAAEIHVEHLSKLFGVAGLKKDWAAAIVDENGRYVARSLVQSAELANSRDLRSLRQHVA